MLIPVGIMAQTSDCRQLHQGIFKTRGLFGSLNTIIINGEKYQEVRGRSGMLLEYDMKWLDDCLLMLYHKKVLKGNDSLLAEEPGDTLFQEIIPDNNYWHTVKSCINDSDQKTETTFFKVDTIHVYKDVSELEEFKDYTGLKGGGTFVGYNYVVYYKQHETDSSKFLVSFLEALTIDDKPKFKMLDHLIIDLEGKNEIAISSCRFKKKFDKEIIVVYCSDDAKEESTVLRAWRFNKQKLKIEEVNANDVRFKESDKMLPMWMD